jgi:hypothetical protein
VAPYKRNQIEEAVRLLQPNWSREPGKQVPLRIKRLLDTDRQLGRDIRSGNPLKNRYAFFSEEPPGTGSEVWFSEYEAFAISVGRRLLNSGLPQETVVLALRLNRSLLEKGHRQATRVDARKLKQVKPAPGVPADAFKELFFFVLPTQASPRGNVIRDAPLAALRPARILKGERQLISFMSRELGFDHVAITIPVLNASIALRSALAQTTASTRGRK